MTDRESTRGEPPEGSQLRDVEPEVSGSSGEQVEGEGDAAEVTAVTPVRGELGQFSWSEAAEDLSAIRGHAGMRLLTEGLRSLEAGRADAIRQADRLGKKLEQCRDDHAKVREEAAVLAERIQGLSEGRRLRHASITFGGILLGSSITLVSAEAWLPWIMVGLVGVLLMVSGWMGSRPKENR